MSNFWTDYHFSQKPEYTEQELQILQRLYPNAEEIRKADLSTDKRGADYSVKLHAEKIYIDFKRRRKNCSRFWKHGTEIVIELWSNFEKKVKGWLFKENSITDKLIFTFDKADCTKSYLLDFRELQTAVKDNYFKWIKQYRIQTQRTGNYHSRCIFLPIFELMKIMTVQEIKIPAFSAGLNSLSTA